MVYKHAYLNTLLLLHSPFMCQPDEDVAKRGGWRPYISHGNDIVEHGKSWNCVFEFLWEP